MKSVKPYGRSATRFENAKLERQLLPKTESNTLVGFETLEKDPAFVMAMWVSVIDKVAVKPTGQAKPTTKQYNFREKLGNAAWAFIEAKALLPAEMKEKFWSKVHPYPVPGQWEITSEDKENSTQKKGRWFKTFFGDVSIFDADVEQFGQMVFDHLYTEAKRVHADAKPRKTGLIRQRVLSLKSSVPKPPKEFVAEKTAETATTDRRKAIHAPLWSEPDGKDLYCKHNNLPGEIHKLASDLQEENRPLLNRHVGPILFEHYGQLFASPDGPGVLSRSDIRDEGRHGLLDYHDAVKDTYRRILAGHKARGSGSDKRLLKVLPKTPSELYTRVMAGRRNQNIGGLIRLGKVAHYSFTKTGELDHVSAAVENWDPDVINQDNPYWTSAGQSEIKRNEALIRVWRSILASAAVTLVDWINPNPNLQGDPTIEGDFGLMLNQFDESHFDQKAQLLFGAAAENLVRSDQRTKFVIVEDLREGIKDLRNAAFHFKGRKDFAIKIAQIGREVIAEQFTSLYSSDLAAQGTRYLKDLKGADVEFFAKQHQVDTLLRHIRDAHSHSAEALSQPRLNRLLTRAGDTWKGDQKLTFLPEEPSYQKLEASSALRCRYVCTKLLYDRVFPHWFAQAPAQKLNGWKTTALDRTTKAASDISGDEKAVAKAAAALDFGAEGVKSPIDLLARISAETATEIRVQKGYDPDPAKAREKSKYLDDIVLDIFALAFNAFLDQPDLTWLSALSASNIKPGQEISELPDTLLLTSGDGNADGADPWKIVFYTLLHLVSTSEVSQLLHQLKKWEVLSAPEKSGARVLEAEEKLVGDVMDVLRLYLDMADDKFDGSTGIDMCYALRPLFTPESLFDKVYPSQKLYEDDLIPIRGLREALRFGNLANQAKFHEDALINKAFTTNLSTLERGAPNSVIARAQKTKTDLHAAWVENGCRLSEDETVDYQKAVATIAKHRELSAHVRFVNHIRLHRLIMRLLGRFADFSGLFERDLYFASLGLMIDLGLKPDEAFTSRGLNAFKEGQIIKALRNARDDMLLHKMKLYFTIDFKARNPGRNDPGQVNLIDIRNTMQHLRLLFGKKGGENTTTSDLTMTDLVNDLRQLMAYDRKLKNAVSKSVIGILEREKLILTWEMDTNASQKHLLTSATVSTQQAFHIKPKNKEIGEISENLNTVAFTKMVAALFGGQAKTVNDVANPAT